MATHSRRGRLRRLAIWSAALAAAFVAVVALAVAGLMASAPSVSSAPRLVAAYLARHGARPLPSPPPRRVAAAITASEDHEFYAPFGVDVAYGIIRYAYAHVLLGKSNQGGSTIAQQLAKRLYTGTRSGSSVKLEQIGLALKLEATYSRPELLSMYLSDAYYGQNAYGLEQAAAVYFGRSASSLSWPQAAMLAGLVQAPSAYDPYVHPALGRQRQMDVFGELVRTGALTRSRAAALSREPLGLRPLHGG